MADKADSVEAADIRANELIAAGALWATLAVRPATDRVMAYPVLDDNDNPTTALWVKFPGILKSRYRVSVTMDPEDDDG